MSLLSWLQDFCRKWAWQPARCALLASCDGIRHICRGVWLYDPKAHALVPYLPDDIRAATELQDFAAGAPVNLLYVAHGERMTDVSPEDRRLYASVDTNFIGQNVYQFCASDGLASVFRARWIIGSSNTANYRAWRFCRSIGP